MKDYLEEVLAKLPKRDDPKPADKPAPKPAEEEKPAGDEQEGEENLPPAGTKKGRTIHNFGDQFKETYGPRKPKGS